MQYLLFYAIIGPILLIIYATAAIGFTYLALPNRKTTRKPLTGGILGALIGTGVYTTGAAFLTVAIKAHFATGHKELDTAVALCNGLLWTLIPFGGSLHGFHLGWKLSVQAALTPPPLPEGIAKPPSRLHQILASLLWMPLASLTYAFGIGCFLTSLLYRMGLRYAETFPVLPFPFIAAGFLWIIWKGSSPTDAIPALLQWMHRWPKTALAGLQISCFGWGPS